MKKFSRTIGLTLFLIIIVATTAGAVTLIPGGQVIGLTLEDDTVTVVDFDPTLGANAQAAGLEKGDRIVKIGSERVCCAEDVHQALRQCADRVELSVERNGKVKKMTVAPTITADGPKLGVYLRQGMTGLGTVTFYNPNTGALAALGHGVNSQKGELVRLKKGSIYPARVASVKKGCVGAPGQLLGSVTQTDAIGALVRNTDRGVFGKTSLSVTGTPLPVASCEEIHTGAATIRSTVAGESLREYSVEILKIYPKASGRTRNMLLRVTDPALLEATGGIVQGMSGSPIIQDGKLIGAVTHVLVNDPTTGYGIFIENMLDAAA